MDVRPTNAGARATLEANLRALRARDPTLAARVEAADPLPAAPVTTSSGHPTLTADGVLLHNAHDPWREAARWGEAQRERLALAEDPVAVVLGFGLGYHVEALGAVWDGPLVVVEPDLGLLRTALETRELCAVLARVTLVPGPIDTATVDGWGAAVLLPHAPSLLREGDVLRGLRERIAGRTVLRDLRLRVLVVSPLAGGSYPITGYCARALAELGHDVTVLDLAPFAGSMEAIGSFTPRAGARRVIETAFGRFLGAGIIAAVEAVKPDLVLAMAQAPLDPAVLDEIGRRGVLRAFWFVEDHRLFPYWRDVIGGYDHFFGIQQGTFLTEARRLGNGRAAYLPLAADPVVHRPLALTAAERAEYAAPVSFVGAGYRNRRLAFRALLDCGLRIWGTEWGGAGPVEAALQRSGARISTADSVRIFNATEVNLNLHSSTWVDGVDPVGDFVNPRTFELAAAGAFQLVDARALLPPLFSAGTELATFTDAGELRPLLRHWLAHPEERAVLAAAARTRCLAQHTYRHRMESLLETVCAADAERIAARPRGATVGDAARAEGATPLGGFLATLPPQTPFTLDGVVQRLLHHEGDLTDPEAVMLFLHQFDELYVKEARQ